LFLHNQLVLKLLLGIQPIFTDAVLNLKNPTMIFAGGQFGGVTSATAWPL
jgi:hypothetical protein